MTDYKKIYADMVEERLRKKELYKLKDDMRLYCNEKGLDWGYGHQEDNWNRVLDFCIETGYEPDISRISEMNN